MRVVYLRYKRRRRSPTRGATTNEPTYRYLTDPGLLSQSILAAIVEVADDAIVLIDGRQRIILFNEGAEKLFGYRASEVLGQHLGVLLPERLRERHIEHVDAFRQAPERSRRMTNRSEIAGRRKDGTEFSAEASIVKVDCHGQLVMAAILRDVTERKRVEEDLRHLASIVEVSDDAIVSTTADQTIVSWNPGAERLYGYTADEMRGRPGWLLVPAERRHEMARVHETLRRGGRLQHETVQITKDGRQVYVSQAISAHTDASGRVTGYSEITRDITNRKRAEERLRELRAALEAAVEGIARLGRDGRYLSVNAAYAALVGYAPEDLVGTEWSKTVHPEDRERVMEAYRTMLGAGKAEVEARAVRKDGSVLYKQVIMVRAEHEGEYAGHYCFMKDISPCKQAEQRLTLALREKELLLREIHHRVKNNLQLISSILSLQASQVADGRLREIVRESQHRIRAVAFVHEKLYQSGDLARLDLAEYLRSLAQHLLASYQISPDAVAVDIHAEEAIEDFDAAMSCGLIISELLTNALKHAFVGGRRGRVRIDLLSCEGRIRSFVVSDNGVGFPPSVDFRSTTSLGLQLVCALVEQMSGSIDLERNGGTTWKITFATQPDA